MDELSGAFLAYISNRIFCWHFQVQVLLCFITL